MRKTLIIFGLLLSGLIGSSSELVSNPNETKVYICDSEGATKYHYKKDCRGLNNCKHTIRYVSLDDAKKKGKKTLCGWED